MRNPEKRKGSRRITAESMEIDSRIIPATFFVFARSVKNNSYTIQGIRQKIILKYRGYL